MIGDQTSTNVMEELSRQVERVATIRERYRCLEDIPRVVLSPATYLMSAAIEAGHKAAGSGDILQIVRAIEDLRGFEE